MRGDVRDPVADGRGARRTSTRSSTSPRSSAIPPARAQPELAREVNLDATQRAARRRQRGRRRALRLRVDLQQLRQAGNGDALRDGGVRARPVSLYAETKVAAELRGARAGERRARADLPALRDGLRHLAADALRPDRQRVHARPARSTGSSSSTASSSGGPTSTSATPPARSRPCSTPRAMRSRRGLQRRRHRRELPQARHRRAPAASAFPRPRSSYVHKDEDPRDYRVSFEKVTPSSSDSRSRAGSGRDRRGRGAPPERPGRGSVRRRSTATDGPLTRKRERAVPAARTARPGPVGHSVGRGPAGVAQD